MTSKEITTIINRLKSGFNFNRFADDGVEEEYQRFLAKHPFPAINAAIDALIETDSQRVPPISHIIKAMRELSKTNTALGVSNTEQCHICNNKGYIFMKQTESNLNNNPYEYVLHCICPVGMSQAYDGKNCKKGEQTNYTVPSVTQYFDDYAISEMKKANMNKGRMTAADKAELKKQLAKFGLKMPELKEYEKGDAWWEGEYEPSF